MSEVSYPTLDPRAAMDAIATIRALDLRVATIEEILELLTPVFCGYRMNAPRFEPGVHIFRIRVCEKPTKISELSYPPPRCTPLGRVNRRGNPVLYCCTSRQAPFFESRPIKGQTVAIIHWTTTAPLLVNHVGYSSTTFQKLGSSRPHGGWGTEPVPVPGDDANRLVADFLADAFTRLVPTGSEHEFKLSVAIAEKLFSDDLFDGLLYPTVAMRANADNFALKPRYADHHLRFVKAEYVRIDAVRDLAFDITILDTATAFAPDEMITWKGRLDRWVLRNQGDQVTFAVENGQWVARNVSGQIVDPE